MHLSKGTLEILRTQIRQHTHADEATCVRQLLAASQLTDTQRSAIISRSHALVTACRKDTKGVGVLERFMQQYDLSNREGIAVMCMAEALLRIPDTETIDDLIAEKLNQGDWDAHFGKSNSMLVNASTWGLSVTRRMLSGKLPVPQSASLLNISADSSAALTQLFRRLGAAAVRGAIGQAMKVIAQQYVLGRTVPEAIRAGRRNSKADTRFSFDMLGEGARTMDDAQRYFEAYSTAISDLGVHHKAHSKLQYNSKISSQQTLQENTQDDICASDSISVKLSALHPRYEALQSSRVNVELLPKVTALALQAKTNGLGFTIDAEESERLELSLTLFESLATNPKLDGWNGLGLALQAYSKRAPFVAHWLIALARKTKRRFLVRLVKGAYWDHEIKLAQQMGFDDYPVYTRKANTDLCYQTCAEILLKAPDAIYPQFATHNAYTVSLIQELAGTAGFEFQRLHGMGELLFKHLDSEIFHSQPEHAKPPIRIYAPVGAHKDLLPYLVRRLLENGANNSFVHRFLDHKVPIEQLVKDVQIDVKAVPGARHTGIPAPIDIYRSAGHKRANSHGIDLNQADTLNELVIAVKAVGRSMVDKPWMVGPIINGVNIMPDQNPLEAQTVFCPADSSMAVGLCQQTTKNQGLDALASSTKAQPSWNAAGGKQRALILEHAAHLMEQKLYELTGIIAYEAGRTLADGVAEVREAVDFLRYYALQIATGFDETSIVTSPLGERCERHLKGSGVFFCISPRNFPLAIFVGQIAAALAAGNAVIAKPAGATPIIASRAIELLHQAGVPGAVLQFLPGSGATLGKIFNNDPRIAGVVFTGSTAVARSIHMELIERTTPIPRLIAETGGQNVMVVDSSALHEQVVDDAIRSAFYSAGQRCSALRVMFVQEEIADRVITMLCGAMDQLVIGNPWDPATDIGPIIDAKAKTKLQQHIENLTPAAIFHHPCELPTELDKAQFLAPQLFEIERLDQLSEEHFGPVLHLIRYNKANLKNVIEQINATGYGLTLGIHSRIEGFSKTVVEHTRVGNYYINRNMVGAVVGTTPFGGQGLSGTGPKAGGPHYITAMAQPCLKHLEAIKQMSLPITAGKPSAAAVINGAALYAPTTHQIEVAVESAREYQFAWNHSGGAKRQAVLNQVADLLEQRLPELTAVANIFRHFGQHAKLKCGPGIMMPSATGETNLLSLNGRGIFVCSVLGKAEPAVFICQIAAALAAGNAVIATASHTTHSLTFQHIVETAIDAGVPKQVLHFIPNNNAQQSLISDPRIIGIACNKNLHLANKMQRSLLRRSNTLKQRSIIIPWVTLHYGPQYFLRFTVEQTTTTNITASGGNTQLLSLE
ncbi:MAG: bifunctional proline dehydrogenase/L-glutamate gamma-semialdehyde dehydrogenase PutA [Pseudomonadales bacterium]|nr:bifunctional proline dehydrogenase/L-glutamate gamma-semialdehyde dehydrogenase PutA [Pseudomonadales bacterium]